MLTSSFRSFVFLLFMLCVSSTVVLGQDREVSSLSTQDLKEILELAPEHLLKELFTRLDRAQQNGGPHFLRTYLRWAAEAGLRADQLKELIKDNFGAETYVLSVRGSEAEVTVANRVLERSGLGFLSFVSEPVDKSLPSELVVERQQLQTLNKADLIGTTSLLFGIAVGVGVVEVILQQEMGAVVKQEGSMSLLTPYVGMGLFAAGVHPIYMWWEQRLDSWVTHPGLLSWRPEASWSSLRDLGRRIVVPRGYYLHGLLSFAYTLSMQTVGSVVAAFPGNPVNHFYGKPWEIVLIESVLFTVSVGGLKALAKQYREEGSFGELSSTKFARFFHRSSSFARVLGSAPWLHWVPTLVSGVVTVGVTAPLALHRHMGEARFERETAQLMTSSNKSQPKRSLCSALVSFVQRAPIYRNRIK
jgi:hypothetical protein